MKTAALFEKVAVNIAKNKILEGVTLALPEGKVIGLLGPSGAGKTTLMRVLVGLQRVSSGQVTVLGRPAGAAELRPLVGYVTQSPSVYGDLTVRENLEYFAAMLRASKARVEEIIATVHLDDQTGQMVGSLSGGQRARVSLGVALLGSPRLLVLDEPTVGLDPVLRTELWDQFHELARGGVTLLVSSHVMDEAKRCDSLALIRDGRMLATGTPAELMSETNTHDIEAAFLKLVEAAS
ncbi:MAG: ABC transporter ATP-binding protein [Candidatus Saccharimonadales bacterium]